ncbi:5'-3' exonuclease [Mycoplasma sp. 2704]|uniref:5'-3' exonuclease n=1 Tax=Mycoplasma sp. 2704 TaxID=3108529 RepID=UPI002B1D7C69|nr:5'-3' exonuclease [Mycoplasma sp. 2704]MEA4134413.1 5'-3' exonuclease [Mycoplasma sp. 2704]
MDNKNLHLLVDGNYLSFQSFYATYYGNPNDILRTSTGFPTNAINLFFHQLLKIFNQFNPTHIFIAFDSQGKTFRHEAFDEYKSGRASAPSELFVQMDKIKEMLTLLEIPWKEQTGYEADDLIGTYVKNVAQGEEKIIFSKDRDLHQLIDEHTSVIVKRPKKNKFDLLTLDIYPEEYGIYPNQVPDYKGLAGDSSDNLPGIKGIGKKTAISILDKYKSFINLYEQKDTWADNFTKSIITKLESGYDQGLFCYKMAQLYTNVPDFNESKDNYLLKLNLQNAMSILDELELVRLKESMLNYDSNSR